MRFWKYHGTGNDFIMVEDLDDVLRLEPDLDRRGCATGSAAWGRTG